MVHSPEVLMELVMAAVERVYGEPLFCVLIVPKPTAESSLGRPVGSDGVDVHSSLPQEEMVTEAIEAALETATDPNSLRRRFAPAPS